MTCMQTKTIIIDHESSPECVHLTFPRTCTHLEIGANVEFSSLPENLVSLLFVCPFSRKVECELPKTLTRLNCDFIPPIWPYKLEDLEIFAMDLTLTSFPDSLKCLAISGFDDVIEPGIFPNSLISLNMPFFSIELQRGILPNSLQTLKLESYYGCLDFLQDLKCLVLFQVGSIEQQTRFPESLQTLKVANLSKDVVLPHTLITLKAFHMPHFFPSGLLRLRVRCLGKDDALNMKMWPPSVREVKTPFKILVDSKIGYSVQGNKCNWKLYLVPNWKQLLN